MAVRIATCQCLTRAVLSGISTSSSFPYRQSPSGGESPCFGPSLHGKKPAHGSENTHGDERNRATEEFPSTRCTSRDKVNDCKRDDDAKEDGEGPHDNEGARCGCRRESEDFERTHRTFRRGHAEAPSLDIGMSLPPAWKRTTRLPRWNKAEGEIRTPEGLPAHQISSLARWTEPRYLSPVAIRGGRKYL